MSELPPNTHFEGEFEGNANGGVFGHPATRSIALVRSREERKNFTLTNQLVAAPEQGFNVCGVRLQLALRTALNV